MCTGRQQFKAKKDNYLRELGEREVSWANMSNNWNMRNDQYDITTKENVLANSRQIGGIQRNFGLEVSQFFKNKETLFRQKTGKTPANEGDRANSFGRSMELAALYNEAAQGANLRRADIKQTEDLNASTRQLQSEQSKALGTRGFQPMRPAPPARPKGPSFLDQALGVATTAASFISPIQSIGKAAGLGLGAEAGTMRHLWFGA